MGECTSCNKPLCGACLGKCGKCKACMDPRASREAQEARHEARRHKLQELRRLAEQGDAAACATLDQLAEFRRHPTGAGEESRVLAELAWRYRGELLGDDSEDADPLFAQ